MHTYTATFHGRKLGAIGIFYDIKTEVQADDPEAARLAIYERYDHIQGLHLERHREVLDDCREGYHYSDNQGLCHRCGKLLNPDWWEAYAGKPHPDA